MSNTDFHETLSRLSATSKGNGTERINEWINNSPNGAEVSLQSTNYVPTTAHSINSFAIQILPQQTQIVGTKVGNEAVVTNPDPSAALVPTLSFQLPVSNVTTPQQTPAVQPSNTQSARLFFLLW